MAEDIDKLRELVAQVAAAYFSNSQVAPAEISQVVDQIAASLSAVGAPGLQRHSPARIDGPPPWPTSVEIRKSVTPQALISFEDGQRYKTLRRHLSTRGLTPEQYRAKWGLPVDYPMMAKDYSARRAELARITGLGGRKDGGPKSAASSTRRAKKPTPIE